MTRFSKLHLGADNKPVETDIREIAQSDMMKCPHFIMVPEHYRADGSCRCNEPDNRDMIEWGYVWDSKTSMWGAGEDE